MDCIRCKRPNSPECKFCPECGMDLRLAPVAPQDPALIRAVGRELRSRIWPLALISLLSGVAITCSIFLYIQVTAQRDLAQRLSDGTTALATHTKEHDGKWQKLEEQVNQFAAKEGKDISAKDLRPFVAEEVRLQLDERWKDQKLLRLETADLAVRDITEKTKDLLSLFGIPVAIMLGVFGFLGVKSYTDFRDQLRDAESGLFVQQEQHRRDGQAMLDQLKGEIQTQTKQFQGETAQILLQAQLDLKVKLDAFTDAVNTAQGKINQVVVELAKKLESDAPAGDAPTP